MDYSEYRDWKDIVIDKLDAAFYTLRSEKVQARIAKATMLAGYLIGMSALLPHQSETLQHNQEVTTCAKLLDDEAPKVMSYDDISQDCEPFVRSFTITTDIDARGEIKSAYFVPSKSLFMANEYWYQDRDEELVHQRYELAGQSMLIGGAILGLQGLARRRELHELQVSVLSDINALPGLPEA